MIFLRNIKILLVIQSIYQWKFIIPKNQLKLCVRTANVFEVLVT